ncbi:MAG: hypothetical protein JOZ05_19915 [Acetobacteraceae bacterium]|nr:hypothetical protein [Acetobacteraceae bacterium]
MPVLLAFAGLAVDLGFYYRESMRLQLAADAAAMGAAHLLSVKSATIADFKAAGLLEARAVTSNRLLGTLQTPIGVTVAADWSQVTVTLSSVADTYLSRFAGVGAPTLIATATAGVQQPSTCVLALSPSASPGIQVDNMGGIVATGCGIFADSTAGQAMYLNSGTISGASVGAVGGVATSNSGSNTLSPSPGTSYAPTQSDPFASLKAPTAGACSYTNGDFSPYKSTPYQFTQSKNVFCGNTVIGGNGSTDTFDAGTYFVVNGNLTFNNATVTQAQGVTFVLTGTSPGIFSWTNYSNTTTTMTAPTSGATAGILVWQTCPTSGSAGQSTFAGGSTLQISGSIYMPCGEVDMSNNAKVVPVSGSSSGLVASKIWMTGSARFTASSGTSASAAAQVTLLQ